MASLSHCIDTGLESRLVAEQMALDLKDAITKFSERHILEGVDPAAARRMAQTDAIKAKMAELALQRRQKALQIIKVKEAIDAANAHPKGFARGVGAMITKDIQDILADTNFDYRAKAIEGQFHMKIATAMERFRTTTLGLRQDIAGMREVVREIEGVNTGNKIAKQFAKQIAEVFEDARIRFNRAGGNIGKLDNWFPHWWDPKLIAKISKEDFVEQFGSKLDREKMTNHLGIPMDDLEIRLLLEKAYNDIRTDGLHSMEPSGAKGGTKLANRHQEHRILKFKNTDDWLELNDAYGRPDFYTTMTDHISNMSHEISMMEIFGPNPQATYQYLRGMTQKKLAQGKGSELKIAHLDRMWNVASGKINNSVWVAGADFMKSTRALLVSAQLGTAMISSINDPIMVGITAWVNKIPVMKIAKETLRQLNPASKEDRIYAVKMGLGADAWTTRALAANRYTELTGSDFAAKAADVTMRGSLLSPWTDGLRKGTGLATFDTLATESPKTFNALHKKHQAALARYKITPDEWDIIRATNPITHKGSKYWSIENFMKREDITIAQKNTIVMKVHEMTLGEVDHAILMPDVRSRSIMTMGTQRGTWSGETARLVGMYKSFPLLMIQKHLYRGASLHGTANKMAYLSQLTIGLTVMGAIALQAKEIAMGKNPRDMEDPRFWRAAYLQGGGMGIFGDFIFAESNRFGRSFMSTLAGPGWGLADDIWNISKGNIDTWIEGKDTNISADMIQFLRRYTPGGTIWYLKGIYNRTILDQLQKLADPKAYKKFRTKIKKRQREYGQDYWWKPGSITPESAPDLTAAGG